MKKQDFKIRTLDKNLYNIHGVLFPGDSVMSHPVIEARIELMTKRYESGLDLWTGDPLPEETVDSIRRSNNNVKT